MNKTIGKVAVISALFFTYSCGDATKENTPVEHDTHEEHAEKEAAPEAHHHEEGGLTLDDGKLWTANPETTTGVNNMINTMSTFTEKTDVAAFGKLTNTLKSEFTMIFEKCTMTGEAHNQLHNFLVPINELFESLGSSDIKQCQDSYTQLSQHLGTYKKFFK